MTEEERIRQKAEEKISGNYTNPSYVTDYGVTLDLRAIGILVVKRWDSEYKKACPPPTAPVKLLENGEEWGNINDPTYKAAAAEWTEGYNDANVAFLFNYGVVSNPPDGWVYPFPDLAGGKEPDKLMWLETILSGDDLQILPRVIMGISNITEDGLADAEKN